MGVALATRSQLTSRSRPVTQKTGNAETLTHPSEGRLVQRRLTAVDYGLFGIRLDAVQSGYFSFLLENLLVINQSMFQPLYNAAKTSTYIQTELDETDTSALRLNLSEPGSAHVP
ncbi:hypothetical protein H4Q26_010815 [Puccinia striiformis f. sp. tritici PST-130]|nr:hypothetical protein Pst134EB_027243 [Puccinia striiformis f. sp. tritici]KAI9616423.1 hypothetical protein H4Q26_010815 [Puccinia striiformis f. sp. tritici PST-130]